MDVNSGNENLMKLINNRQRVNRFQFATFAPAHNAPAEIDSKCECLVVVRHARTDWLNFHNPKILTSYSSLSLRMHATASVSAMLTLWRVEPFGVDRRSKNNV